MSETLLVFVYGTLMPGYRNYERFIAPHLISCRSGTTSGLLYDLPAGYPGVIEGNGTIFGKIMELPLSALGPLDALEGYDPAVSAAENEYSRKKVKVRCEEGSEVEAWIYLMTPERIREMSGIQVESGAWRG